MDEDLLAFYAQGGEEQRLVAGGPSRLEFARTLELLGRLLPPAPLDVLDAGDRHRALLEAVRVTRPGGVVICTAITRFAALLDGLDSGLLSQPEWRAAVDRTLASGAHTNPTRHPDLFTTAYFHRPEELQDELVAAGLVHEGRYGVEGPGTLLWSRWDDDRDRENLLLVARLLEAEPSVLGMSPHLLAVGRKPRVV